MHGGGDDSAGSHGRIHIGNSGHGLLLTMIIVETMMVPLLRPVWYAVSKYHVSQTWTDPLEL